MHDEIVRKARASWTASCPVAFQAPCRTHCWPRWGALCRPAVTKLAPRESCRCRRACAVNVGAPGVKPQHPSRAIQARVQGTMVLQSVIAKDGTVHDLRVISGQPSWPTRRSLISFEMHTDTQESHGRMTHDSNFIHIMAGWEDVCLHCI